MTAIKNTSIIEGNLVAAPQIFPKGQYVARVTFRILHNSRRLDQNTNKWVDGRTTAVQVNFYGTTAERYIAMIEQQPDLFAKGTPVVAWGDVNDRPDAYTDRDGQAVAMNVINGARIIPDPIRQQQRAAGRSRQQQRAAGRSRQQQRAAGRSRQQQSTPAMPAIKDDDPWASEM